MCKSLGYAGLLVARSYDCQYELISTACRRGPGHADISARGSEVKCIQVFRLRRSACSKRLRLPIRADSTACRRGPRHADVSARGSEVKCVQVF